MEKEKVIRFAAYVRFDSNDKDCWDKVFTQLNGIKKATEDDSNMVLCEIVCDDARKDIMAASRPGLSEVFKKIKEEKLNAIAVDDLTVLSNNSVELCLLLMDEIAPIGAELIFNKASINCNNRKEAMSHFNKMTDAKAGENKESV